MDELTILVAARGEEDVVADTVVALRQEFPGVEIIVAVGDSPDATADRAEEAGAIVLRLARRGKGEALSAAERAAAPGGLLLCDADLRGSLRPLAEGGADLRIAAFRERVGGGFGIAKEVGRALIRLRAGYRAREPLSGQRYLTERARAACFPLAPGFGCEVRMTIDALRAGLRVEEVDLDLLHRATRRDLRGFAHRGRQLVDALLATGPLALNHRGLRLPLVGWSVALAGALAPPRVRAAVAAVTAVGLADDLWSGPERGWHGHLRSGRTTGILKLVAIPAVGYAATRSVRGALLVGLGANALNLLDTRPGRALKAFLLATAVLRATPPAYAAIAVVLLPYDLRERVMLGDAGSNALGAVLALGSVAKFPPRALAPAILALAAFNAFGERRSIGELIERTPGLSHLDRLGRA